MYERVCVFEGVGELKQEVFVNLGNVLCEWVLFVISIFENKGGGFVIVVEFYKQVDER